MIVMFSSFAYADSIFLDKQEYTTGDTMIVSGSVTVAEGHFIGLQILNPTKSDIVMIDQFLPQDDGSFSKSYKTQGTKWNSDGGHTIKIVYNSQTFENTFGFKKIVTNENSSSANESQTKEQETKSETKQEQVNSETKTITTQSSSTTKNASNNTNTTATSKSSKSQTSTNTTNTDPKLRVNGFPDPLKSPDSYIERYETDQKYKDWFKKTFPEYSISKIVSYPPTHIEGFPDNSNPPSYYIKRYNAEQVYKDWFDGQFPDKSIYEVLGYHESLFQNVPNWIKNNAKWWSSGLISDDDFLKGISYLIEEQILLVEYIADSETTVNYKKTVPLWIKNTSEWWADGKIDENEFLKGIKFLIENGIIRI